MKLRRKNEEDDEIEKDDELEEEINEVATKLSAIVAKNLGIKTDKKESISSRIYCEKDLTKDQKSTLDFFQALFTNDVATLKSLSEGVDASGGYLVPDQVSDALIQELSEPTRMRSLVNVVKMERDVLRIPKVVSLPKMRWVSESASKSTTTAEFSEATITAHKQASIIYLSDELKEDVIQFNLIDKVVQMLSDAIAEEEDRVITTGNGTGQPVGIRNCSIGSIASTTGQLSFDDMINLIYLLPAKYRQNAVILATNKNIREMRKLKDSQGRYLWQEAIAQGQTETFYGYPIFENNNLSDSEIYFGNLKRLYTLGTKNGISLTISNTAGDAWTKDLTGIRVVLREGGNCVLENACRKLTGIT